MKFQISNDAAKWFIDEFNLEHGDHVQFYIKIYGGIPTPRPSYFLGIRVGEVSESSQMAKEEGISFYFNEADTWFLDDLSLSIELENGEAAYKFSEM